jgi:hypothetical protein
LNSSSSPSEQTISFAVQEKRSSSLFCHQTGMLELELHLEGKILKQIKEVVLVTVIKINDTVWVQI